MPSLPTKSTRRKRVTPKAVVSGRDAWSPWLRMHEPQSSTAASSAAAGAAMGADAIAVPELRKKRQREMPLTFFDLPAETQAGIIAHCTLADLIAVALVSKPFHDLAAAQLYRNFHIVFPDDDDISFDSPIDGLAGGLDTLVTSEYDYVQFVREVVLETLSGGMKGERAYRHYTSDLSCGKFMNTLFLLMLRRAKGLETFKWDIRVELSRPVYKALHNIPALRHLHIRMHSGSSIYQTPPPLPSLGEPVNASQAESPKEYASVLSAVKANIKIQPPKRPRFPRSSAPPTISGFKNLKTLSILDMDTLAYIPEIRKCIQNSSSTLSKLKLSFSESLARQARKPPPADDTGDDSDQEIDQFGNIIPPPPPVAIASSDDGAPAKALLAQEEKKAQEAVLGRIFGFENSLSSRLEAKDDEPSSPESVDEEKEAEDELESPADVFVKDLMLLSKKLMTAVNGTSRTQQQKETLETIEKAAKKYVKEKDEEAKAKAAKDAVDNGSEGSSNAKATPVSSADSITGKIDDDSTAEDKSKEAESEAKSSGLFDDETKDCKSVHTSADGLNPDDIDIYEPEVIVDEKDLEEDAVPDLSVSESAGKVAEEKSDKSQAETVKLSKEDMEELTDFAAQLETQAERLRARSETILQEFGDADDAHKVDTLLAELKTSTSLIEKRLCQLSQLKKLMHGSEKCTTDVTKKFEAGIDAQQKKTEAMSEYVRTTRGLALRSLAIYLIPIKASVLSKAFDLTVLRSITLLNVGLQTAFWNHLAKENKTSPLPLRKIHTDNVTMPFLTFVNQLETLTELFILERTTKSQEYSFAPKTSVTNNSIRRLVLKKHISSLKRLVIKNENDLSWDANERFLELLCRKGKNLEELAISFSSSAVHTFNQYLPGLTNLKAIHIINFRNDDTCHWVLREIRKFVVDNVSHHPSMKLEFVALDGNVERLIRPAAKARARSKGKGKAAQESGGGGGAFPTLETLITGVKGDESSSEEESEGEGYLPGLKLKTQESGRFYDVYGVRMWRKDVLLGRL